MGWSPLSRGARATPSAGGELAWLLLLSILWGSSYLLIKVAVAAIPPLTLIALRVVLAAAILIAVIGWRGERLPTDRNSWRRLFVQALLSSIAPWTLLAWAQQHVDSALAGVLNSTSPIFVFLITALLTRHEAMTSWKLAGALLGTIGVALIVGADAFRGAGQQVAGQLAILSSAALYGCAAVHGTRFSSIPPTIAAAGTMIWGAIFLVPLSLAIDRPWLLRPTAIALASAVALGIACTALALLIYFRLVKTLGSMGVASNSYLRAAVSVVLGVVILGEHITVAMAIGLLAIVLGVGLINLASTAKRTSCARITDRRSG